MHNEALEPKIKLNNDIEIPVLGLGVWKASNAKAATAVSMAISHGYVLIDTAKQYGNELGVGNGIQDGLKVAGKKIAMTYSLLQKYIVATKAISLV